MKVILRENTLVAVREKGDTSINATGWSPDGESILLYRIKNILNNNFDFNLIKTRMHKGRRSTQHCLRPAKKLINHIDDSKKIFVYNSSWDVRPANLDWNEYNRAEFNMDWL